MNPQSSEEIPGKRLVSQTREMRVLQGTSRIHWIYHLQRKDRDGPEENRWNFGLADPYDTQATLLLSRIWKLLPMIHQKLI